MSDLDLSNKPERRVPNKPVSDLEKIPEVESSSSLAPPKYEVRPDLLDRFQALAVKEIVDQSMRDNLTGKCYVSSQSEKWVKEVANVIREKVKALDMKRYKIICQVVLGEIRGAGIQSGMRCLWDSECDNYVSHMFQNESLFCHTTVFGVYFY